MPPRQIFFALMGVTGAGKSFFARSVTGDISIKVAEEDDLESCTQEVQVHKFIYKDIEICLVDTPGFSDTERSEAEILRRIATWLEDTYKRKVLLTGIIYLHPISRLKMEGSDVRNLRMFKQLCGSEALDRVLLASTHWSDLSAQSVGEKRETQLKRDKFWGQLISQGARTGRYMGTRESGLELLEQLLSLDPVSLRIQKELVDEKKSLADTDAGYVVGEDIETIKKHHEATIESLRAEMKNSSQSDKQAIEDMKREQEELKSKIAELNEAKEMLNTRLAREVDTTTRSSTSSSPLVYYNSASSPNNDFNALANNIASISNAVGQVGSIGVNYWQHKQEMKALDAQLESLRMENNRSRGFWSGLGDFMGGIFGSTSNDQLWNPQPWNEQPWSHQTWNGQNNQNGTFWVSPD